MKKFLLLAAFFAAFTMSAQEFTLTEVTSTPNVPADRMNNRQGFGYSGAFIVMDKVLGQINAYSAEDGALLGTLETGATASWPAITRDEAGNIIARVDNSWPGNFMADTVVMKIFPVGSEEPVEVTANIFADFEAENGRCDFFSFIEGNVMDEDEGGILWLVTAKSTGILKVPFLGGEIDADHIALFPVEGATLAPTSSTVVNPYIAADGTKHYMLWTRNAAAVDLVMNDTEDGFIGTTFTLPNKGATNGCFPLTFGGKDLVIYTTLPNYGNAWAIAEKNAEEAIAVVEEVPGFVTNGFQCNWLNAEVVNENKAIIYQYFPGNFFKTYELTIGGAEEHTYAVCGAPAALFGMENDWDPDAAPEMTLNEETGLYEWTSAETELVAGNIEFKVVQDHAWDVCYPADFNCVVNVPNNGVYTLNVTYNPEDDMVTPTLTEIPQQLNVYIIGEVNGNSWATNVGVPMNTVDGQVYTADVTLVRPADGAMLMDVGEANYCYFSFATKLMEAADDWNGLAPYRFGAVSDGDFQFFRYMLGTPLNLTYDNGQAFMVPEGVYTFTVDLDPMTLTIEGTISAIETINADMSAKSGRYNLLGQPVNENYKGIVIENGVKKVQK
ncbi:MAG: hypothetical protein IK100_11690 [Muribaculaceae bacterium]|nr:hypothetical protein [Muribaculaceae bacterium]